MAPTAATVETAAAPPFMPLSDRLCRFRDASRERGAGKTSSPRVANFRKAFFLRYEGRPFWERYARSMAYALEYEPVRLIHDERLVGIVYQTPSEPVTSDPEYEEQWKAYCPWEQTRQRQEQEIEPYLRVGGAPGHIGWRWDWILERGIEGHMRVIREHLASATDVKAKRLYRGALILWRSVLRWNDFHVACLRDKAEHVPARERERVKQLIEICRRVPRYPARTFHEAVQSFHFQHLALLFENPFGGNGPGRLDYFLWPYLKRDLKRGIVTLEQAKDLVDELFIRFHERLQNADGWVEAVVPGGVHPDGSSSVNPLSYMMIHSIAALNQTHPTVYPRLSLKDPEDYFDLNVQYLLHGQNRAQIYNDEACLRAIVTSGTPFKDASMYMAGGCMEISVQGMNCDLNFSCVHHVAKTLELVLNGGKDLRHGTRHIAYDGDLTNCRDFEDLYAAFEAELAREYREIVRALDIASECYARYRPCYLLSSLMGDCLDRGREQQDGGARYHEYGFAPLGITTASDSLNAIKRAVFEEQFVSADELLTAMRANYVGHEALQARLRNLPKFGVEDPEADAMCDRVMNSVCTLATQPRARFGGKLKPMIFNFVWTPWASQELGARGDGSRAGEVIGHGMTPRSCAMTKGITAAMNSCTSLNYDCVSGGATTMWDMDDRWINFDLMKALLKTFMAHGGMIFQGNTTSVKELEEALEHPEDYPHLIVRVGGFSAYFITLSRDLQEEIIARRRHAG